ncbi:MAG TPA: tetratricopeptide repeat protein, partial [Terriglobia bacterium]|nr:tetratricopeptide repeat protein [Terriglobia bacterium]
TETGQSAQRTIEVRSTFADEDGKIPIKIEMVDLVPAPVPLKARSDENDKPDKKAAKVANEVQRANDAKGKTKKAQVHLEKALELAPNSPEALNALGETYNRSKDFRKAADQFQKALDVKPDFYRARVNLGGVLLSLGDYDQALEVNSKAVEMQPNDAVAQCQLGQAFFHLKKYDDAMHHLELAKKLDPMSYTLPGLYIAQIYEAKGDNAAALAEYKEVFKTHPNHEYATSIQNEILFLEKQTRK